MGIITRMRKQKAVYWGLTGTLSNTGKPLYSAPIEIDCRWEDVSELFLDENGNQQVSNARVYVDRNLEVLGLLWEGELADLTSVTPFQNTGVFAIRKFERLPNLRNTEVLRTAML